MIQSAVGLIHTVAAVMALLVGLAIFVRPKRGTFHKVLGYSYSVAMLTMIVTAFSIYRLTGSVNLLHGFALVSTITLGRGFYHAVARKPKGAWLALHYHWMCSSYIGLVAAFVAESATRILMPYLYDQGVRSFGWFWAIVGLATFIVVWVGQFLMQHNRGILKGYDR